MRNSSTKTKQTIKHFKNKKHYYVFYLSFISEFTLADIAQTQNALNQANLIYMYDNVSQIRYAHLSLGKITHRFFGLVSLCS